MRRPLMAAIILLFFMLRHGVAAAHGGGQLVAGPAPVGPYTLSVWINPPQPRAGEPLHFTVGVAAPRDGSPVLDAQIQITMHALEHDAPPVTAAATTEQSVNRLFYETDLDIVQEGRYLATVSVAGPEGEGEMAIEVDVLPPSSFNWFVWGIVGLGLVLLIGLWQRGRAAVVERAL